MQIVLFILSLTIFEVLLECPPKSVKFANFQKKVKRSKNFMVGVIIENCPGRTMRVYEWNITEMTNNKVLKTIRAPAFPIKGYTYDLSEVYNTTYKLTCSVGHDLELSAPYTISDTFQFVPDNMHIEMKGGPTITWPAQTTLEIDAESLSKDPSFTMNEHSLNDNEILWTVNPTIPGFTPPPRLRFEIPGKFLKENKTHSFRLLVRRTILSDYVDVQTSNQLIKIVSDKTPKLVLECIRNCDDPNPDETTTFRAICVENCVNVTYNWTLKPDVGKSKTDLGNGYQEFVIEGGAFKPGSSFSIYIKSGKSVSSQTLYFEKKMLKGKCIVEPKTGISGVTLFDINCLGFSSEKENLKYIIYQMQDEKGVMVSEMYSQKESSVYLSEGNPAKLVVEVHDDGYEKEKVELEVEVKPYPAKAAKDVRTAIKNITFDENAKTATSGGTENDVVQTVSYLLDAINNIQPITDEDKRDMHKHLAESLEAVKSHDFDSARQMILILTKMQKLKLETDTKTSRTMGKSVIKSSVSVKKFVTENERVPISLKKTFLNDVFFLSSKLLDEVPELKSIMESETPSNDYDSYDEMKSSKLNIIDDLRDMTNNLFLSIQSLGIAVLDKNVPDQKPIIFKNDLMDFEVRRMNTRTLSKKQNISLTGNKENWVYVPESLSNEFLQTYPFVDYQFGVLNKNAFYWHPNVSGFNTDFVLFDFFHKNFKISSLNYPFYVYLKKKDVNIGVLKGNITSGDVVAYRINVQSGSKLIFIFKAQPESFKVASSECYCNDKDFDNGLEIPSGANESQRTFHVEAFSDKNIIYVCIKKLGAKLDYEANFAMFSCFYWDLKNQNWNADDSHCTVDEASFDASSPLVCKCTHSSFFAGQIFAPPNVINLNLELDLFIALANHWFVFTLLMGILVVWFLLLLLALRLDKKFSKENRIYRLDDNVPGDCHIYTMVVFTGVFIDAGTTANVGFQLIGEKGNSREHIIKARGARMLQRDSQDWFIINTPNYLGDIKKIRLWHNCRGTQPHWYCKRIVVQHLKTGSQYCFIVEKWFSLIWGNGKIYREISIKKENYMRSGRLLLSVHAETQFKDKYLWISVFTRDSQSNFTSLERVGTLGCTFFLSMLASAMFYGIPENAPVDSIDPKSSYFITYRDIIIFIESWLVAVPVGIIVVLLFRNSAPRIKKDELEK